MGWNVWFVEGPALFQQAEGGGHRFAHTLVFVEVDGSTVQSQSSSQTGAPVPPAVPIGRAQTSAE
jgi:hypothetical protein